MAEIKIAADSGAGSVGLAGPSATTGNAAIQFKLPVADGSAGQILQTDGSGNLSWVDKPTSGITHYDTWSLTAQKNWSSTNTFQSSNDFSRNTAVPSIGSAMTENGSGVFTFPVTGIWEIFIQGKVLDSTVNSYTEVEIHKSTDGGSSWTSVAQGDDSIFDDGSNNVYCNPSVKASIDVTSTTDVKAKFTIANEQGALVAGSVGPLSTFVIFKRLGDT